MKNESNNHHIESYLKFYLNEKPKDYAVMITGEWGSGKTYFIDHIAQQFEDNEEKKFKFLKVSLYGVSSIEEIEVQLFHQIYKWTDSKAFKLISKFATPVLNKYTGIDLGDTSLKDILKESLPDDCEAAFIFDDLERSNLTINQSFGFISKILDKGNSKVIIIANETKISSSGENADFESYKLIKEKLVGRTFELKSEPEIALEHFLSIIKDESSFETIAKHKESILATYKESTYQNLRTLKQSIIELPRLLSLMPFDSLKNDDFVKSLCKTLVIFQLENRKGSIPLEDIQGIEKYHYNFELNKRREGDDKENPLKTIENKYTEFDFSRLPLHSYFWKSFFQKGIVEEEEVKSLVKNSIFFHNKSSPAWTRLWYYMDLEEDIFKATLDEVKNSFEKGDYLKPGIIKHVAGIFLSLSKETIVHQDIINTKKWLIETINAIHSQYGIEEFDDQDKLFRNQSYASKYFYEYKSEDFIEVAKLVNELSIETKAKDYPQKAEEILDLIETNPRLFWQKLSPQFPEGSEFYQINILSYISVKKFLDKFYQTQNKDKEILSYFLKDRYNLDSLKRLPKEIKWLKELSEELAAKIDKVPDDQPIGKFNLERFQNKLKDTIDRLKGVE